MQVGWTVFEMSVFVGVEHLVHEVHVPEVVAGPALVLNLHMRNSEKLNRRQFCSGKDDIYRDLFSYLLTMHSRILSCTQIFHPQARGGARSSLRIL